jgi:hypothetical protein
LDLRKSCSFGVAKIGCIPPIEVIYQEESASAKTVRFVIDISGAKPYLDEIEMNVI